MKKTTVISTLSLLFALTLNLSAKTQNDLDRTEGNYELPRYAVKDITMPIPTKMVAPKINRQTSGREVEMIFRIGADGRPQCIYSNGNDSQKSHFRSLESAMRAVLPYWRFEPALDKDGNAISVKVALPVRIVNKDKEGVSYASIALAKPTILSVAMN